MIKIKTPTGEIDVKPVDVVILEGKMYGYCIYCRRIIRLGGGLKGTHLCSSDE